MHVEFGADRIRYTGYEIPAATVHPDGTLAAALIRDADWSAHPPEIRTRRGETLFVPAAHSQDLALFCERAAITRVRRFDVWADLLEPFLDTEFPEADQRATLERLRSHAGLDAAAVARIRARVDRLMTAYNIDSMLWEWTHLGLFDLVGAAAGRLVPPRITACLGPADEFYWWAMRLADLPTSR
ncbi:hypothetical protein ACWEVD_07960 [Nocardia thailandica]